MTEPKFTAPDADQNGSNKEAPLVVVVLPTYNEADNLPAITAALLALSLPNLKVVVVDDASPDGTGAIADRLAAHHPGRIKAIHREPPRGLGRAYQAGCRLALEMGAQFIIQMDADFSHSPDDVLRLLEAASDADVVIGSRYVDGGTLDREWNWWRRFLSWWANTVWTQTFLHLSVQDATAGFKCWRRAALEGINLDRIKSNGYVFQVETVYVAEQLGYRVIEIPIFFEDRRLGRSKMTFGVKLEAAWRVLEIRARHRGVHRQNPAVPSSFSNQPHTENS
ncbi:MAG: polyprenol monophosphomannose synthase [Caldilineales bacterium]